MFDTCSLWVFLCFWRSMSSSPADVQRIRKAELKLGPYSNQRTRKNTCWFHYPNRRIQGHLSLLPDYSWKQTDASSRRMLSWDSSLPSWITGQHRSLLVMGRGEIVVGRSEQTVVITANIKNSITVRFSCLVYCWVINIPINSRLTSDKTEEKWKTKEQKRRKPFIIINHITSNNKFLWFYKAIYNFCYKPPRKQQVEIAREGRCAYLKELPTPPVLPRCKSLFWTNHAIPRGLSPSVYEEVLL